MKKKKEKKEKKDKDEYRKIAKGIGGRLLSDIPPDEDKAREKRRKAKLKKEPAELTPPQKETLPNK